MSQRDDYFDKDAPQFNPSEMVAFGVPLASVNAKVDELCQMLQFIQDAARIGVAGHIRRVWYESPAELCHIEGHDSLRGDTLHRLEAMALKHLTRYTFSEQCESESSPAPLAQPGTLEMAKPPHAENDSALDVSGSSDAAGQALPDEGKSHGG